MSIRLIDGSEFLHIPKTGGTWVSQVLKDQGLARDTFVGGHEHADYDRVVYGERARAKKKSGLLRSLKRRTKADDTFRFCFVRHPLTWYESWWKYMNSMGWRDWGDPRVAGGWHPNAGLNGLGASDFNQFVQNVINARPGYVSELFFAYAKPGISFIGKLENLENDLLKVLEHLRLPVDPHAVKARGRVNASQPSDQPIEWDPKIRLTLMQLELPALVYFDYLEAEEREELGLSATLQSAPKLQRVVAS